MHFVLASASPRRADLLRAAGFTIDIAPAGVDERPLPAEPPHAHVSRLAQAKAAAVSSHFPKSVVLGADTVVVIDGQILGKPVDAADAERMLRLLSGRVHQVLTGVCLVFGSRQSTAVEVTEVHVSRLQDEEIAWYVASGEPMDKAGAYAIQGLAGRFIDRIEGSYSNVVGLPIAAVVRLVKRLGCDILAS